KVDIIIFLLSQCLDFDEEKVELKLNEEKLYTILQNLHTFDYKKHADVGNKFKFNQNLKFQWLTDKRLFNMTLICPYITFSFVYKNITIKKHIEIDLYLLIFSHDQSKWDS